MSFRAIQDAITDSLFHATKTDISTAFVDRLQSYSYAPPTPTESVTASPAPSIRELDVDSPSQSLPAVLVQSSHSTHTAWIEGLPVTSDQGKHRIGDLDELVTRLGRHFRSPRPSSSTRRHNCQSLLLTSLHLGPPSRTSGPRSVPQLTLIRIRTLTVQRHSATTVRRSPAAPPVLPVP